jgi:hypothetical protein
MKKLQLITLCFPILGFGQYSNYYNVNANINKNVNISGSVTTTTNINTIDYGQLALANAEREKNRLANLKYADEKQRLIAAEIASNPVKAFDYGITNTWKASVRRLAKGYGFNRFVFKHQIPHKSLFTKIEGYNYQNISGENIITEIEISTPFLIDGLKEKQKEENQEFIEFIKPILSIGSEEFAKGKGFKEGEFSDDINSFVHKKDINRTKVYGKPGFLQTIIYEDDYEYVIKDNYYAVYDGIIFMASVRYKGDKDEITFEDLEGRRYYLKRLCDQIISTSSFYDYKKM